MTCYHTSEVSCPYFYPTRSRGGSAMLPLGDFWTGECRAPLAAAGETESACCNLGYARGECAHFPAAAGPDAVRFTLARDAGERLVVLYAFEHDHYPGAHGALECTPGEVPAAADELLARQAWAYIESYRRRKETE